MICPACGNVVPPDPVVENITICPTCLASLVIADGACRRAVGSDTTVLSDEQLAKLRKQRAIYRTAAA